MQLQKQKFFAVFLILLFIASNAYAINFPLLTGRVVDNANIINSNTKASLETMLANHEAKTTNQIVVATVSSLEGYEIEEYGYQLGRSWAIGQKDKNNGVILLVAPNERAVRIEVGYGLEGILTDALSSKIINTIILPKFKAGDLNGGIVEGAQDIVSVLEGEQVNLPEGYVEQPNQEGIPIWAIIAFILFIFFIRIRFGIWFLPIGGSSFGGSSGNSFRGGGGSFGGGGSSGRW